VIRTLDTAPPHEVEEKTVIAISARTTFVEDVDYSNEAFASLRR
jgi:hypothetical protein